MTAIPTQKLTSVRESTQGAKVRFELEGDMKMANTGDWNSTREDHQSDYRSARIIGIVLSSVGMLIGFLFWLLLVPVMTMGTANCTESSEELVCNSALMNTLAFISLAGIASGLLLTVALGTWQVRKKKAVTPTLLTAWAITVIPMLIFMSAGWEAAG